APATSWRRDWRQCRRRGSAMRTVVSGSVCTVWSVGCPRAAVRNGGPGWAAAVAVMLAEPFPPIVETLRRAAAALRGSEVPFALGGGLACWARGGPESTNDLDLMVRPADAEAALGALERAGMRTERPPEEWLYKAWDGDVLVDVIFRMVDGTVDDELLE